MASRPTIFDEPHHQSLELLCARALASGDIATAFKFADRRCRIPPLPEPHCYVLRAEALFRMGEKPAAIADVAKALEIAPDDIAANRRMLAWGDAKQRRVAAASLIAYDRDFAVLRQAVKVLGSRTQTAFAQLRVLDDAVLGWAAWDGDGPVSVSIGDGSENFTIALAADPRHPLAGALRHAVTIDLRRPRSQASQSITVMVGNDVIFSHRTPRYDEKPVQPMRARRAPAASDEPVTVIVPVYADYEATKACLDSLLAQSGADSRHRIIVVNDATSDARIEKYLAQAARKSRFQLLTNASNLGFVGAVNRALEHVSGGDIVLLNADTVVPAGFIERLAKVAQTADDIGTITPLSNNGEFTSFPVPNRANPLPADADIAAIDRIAAKENAGRVVDIPNGIGFCLYVTRACLDAVGFLSEHYHRGYLEDVDFCLRAREAGYRNVCAPSVYVGHAGSRSFGDEKRSLVVRNLAVIERRFPNYRAECAAFVLADPLRAARAAIERKLPSRQRRPRLLVTGEGTVADIVADRGRALTASDGDDVLILTLRHEARGVAARLTDGSGAVPQSLGFALASATERRSLFDYLQHLHLSRVELADPANIPPFVAEGLAGLDIPYDIFIADSGLLKVQGHSATSKANAVPEAVKAAQVWGKIAKGAAKILAPSDDAKAFAARILPKRDVIRLPTARGGKGRTPPAGKKARAPSLGIVPLTLSTREQCLVHEIARRLNEVHGDIPIVVLGGTLDDLDLMRLDNTFVTGPLTAAELPDAVRCFGLRSLLLCNAEPLFGHPLQSAVTACGLPIAGFDWTNRPRKSVKSELVLDPNAGTAAIADAIGRWMSKR